MSMPTNTHARKRLGDMLVEMGRLTEDDLRMALDRQKKARRPLGEILVSSGLVEQKDMLAGSVQELRSGAEHFLKKHRGDLEILELAKKGLEQ